MDITLIKAIKGNEVHGSDNGKKTGCGINLMKPENITRYITAGTMSDLAELNCEKCKTVLAKKIIKADKKEMSRLLKEEKLREKKGIYDERIVPLGGTESKITSDQSIRTSNNNESVDKQPVSPFKPNNSVKPVPQQPIASAPAKPAQVKVNIDDDLAAFIVNAPHESPFESSGKAAAPVKPAAAKPAVNDDFISKFAIPKPETNKENQPQTAPHKPVISGIDDAIAQFVVPSAKPSNNIEAAPKKPVISEIDDAIAKLAVPSHTTSDASKQPSDSHFDNNADALSKMNEDNPILPETDDLLAKFATSANAPITEPEEILPQQEIIDNTYESDKNISDTADDDGIDFSMFDIVAQPETAEPPKKISSDDDILMNFSLPGNKDMDVIGNEPVAENEYANDSFVDVETSPVSEQNENVQEESANEQENTSEPKDIDENQWNMVADMLFGSEKSENNDEQTNSEITEQAYDEISNDKLAENTENFDEIIEQPSVENESMETPFEIENTQNVEAAQNNEGSEFIESLPQKNEISENENAEIAAQSDDAVNKQITEIEDLTENIQNENADTDRYHYTSPVFADEIPDKKSASATTPMEELSIPKNTSDLNETVKENTKETSRSVSFMDEILPDKKLEDVNSNIDRKPVNKTESHIKPQFNMNTLDSDETPVIPVQANPVQAQPFVAPQPFIQPNMPVPPFVQPPVPNQPNMQNPSQFVQVPQFMGFDANGQPIYAFVQQQIVGYDMNGQPVFAPVQPMDAQAQPFINPTAVQPATSPFVNPTVTQTPIQPAVNQTSVQPAASPFVNPTATQTPIQPAVNQTSVQPATSSFVNPTVAQASAQSPVTNFVNSTPKYHTPTPQAAMSASSIEDIQNLISQSIENIPGADSQPPQVRTVQDDINLSKIGEINKHLPDPVAAAVARSKAKQSTNIFDMQGTKMPVIDSIEDALSNMGLDVNKQKEEAEGAMPKFEEYKAPTKHDQTAYRTAPAPAPDTEEPQRALTKEEIKRRKRQEKIDAKFKKDLAKRGF